MSATPSPRRSSVTLGNDRDRTPELTSKSREKRHREDDDGNDRSGREHRHRHREDDDERRERRHRRDNETEEEREERRRRRRERDGRDGRDRERDDVDRRGSRDRSRESHRSHRSRDVPAIREMTREEKERAREERDRLMAEERREAARMRNDRYEVDRERERDRGMRDRPRSPPRGRRGSPSYDQPPPPPPGRDPATQLLDEADEEARSVFVTRLAARLTSADLGLFFEDKLGRGSVRAARIIHDRSTRRSQGCGYVCLDIPDLVHSAVALTGTLVMGIPIEVRPSDPEGRALLKASMAPRPRRDHDSGPRQNRTIYPPLSTGLAFPPGIDKDSHRDAAIPYHRLFVSDLASNLSSDDVRQIFQSFGVIEFVDLHLDFSGRSVGTAYVQFATAADAGMALEAMNDFELAGRKIRVTTIQERSHNNDQIEESSGYGTRLDAAQRQQLMFKLARTEPPTSAPVRSSRAASPPPIKAAPVNPSPYVIATNMFNPEEETERDWDLDLAEDIEGELKSKYGAVKRIKVDKLSSSGEVYIEFVDQAAAERAVTGLNGRFFGGRKLGATFTSAALFRVHM